MPRAGGQLPDGLLMKMMAIVGSGGKALKFYVFGPEYNFPVPPQSIDIALCVCVSACLSFSHSLSFICESDTGWSQILGNYECLY